MTDTANKKTKTNKKKHIKNHFESSSPPSKSVVCPLSCMFVNVNQTCVQNRENTIHPFTLLFHSQTGEEDGKKAGEL